MLRVTYRLPEVKTCFLDNTVFHVMVSNHSPFSRSVLQPTWIKLNIDMFPLKLNLQSWA